jgi:hypothetical protein
LLELRETQAEATATIKATTKKADPPAARKDDNLKQHKMTTNKTKKKAACWDAGGGFPFTTPVVAVGMAAKRLLAPRCG